MKHKNGIGYKKLYYDLNYRTMLDNENFYNIKGKLVLVKYFKEDINNLNKLNILDYGCGLGQHIYLLKNAIGYDISKYAVNYCKRKGIKATSNLKDIEDNSIDIILCVGTLEHVDTPIDELRNMYNKLKIGGKLILVIPAEKHFKTNFKINFSQHLYCWNFRGINNLLNKINFKVIENKFFRRGCEFKLRGLGNKYFNLYIFLTKVFGLLNYFKFKYTELKIVAIK